MKRGTVARIRSGGQVLVAVIVILLVLATLVPMMVYYANREASWTAKQSENTTAFHMAEAGTEKAYLILTLSSATWTNLQNGITVADYNFDKSFVDVSSGTYAVSITSGPNASEVTVISVGRDPLKRETRALQVIYSNGGVSSAMYANGITATGGVTINWGPMTSLGAISLSGSANQCYPQKYAAAGISTSGTCPCHGTWSATQSPCTDNTEWWAYNCPPGVPPAPTFQLSTYKAQAQAASCPTSEFPTGASPSGSCYWPVGVNPHFSNVVMTSSAAIYIEGSLSVNNGFLWGSVIVMGDVSFSGGGKGAYTIPDTYTPDGIPSTAWKQYQKLDTSAAAEYYGDAGYQTVNASFQFGMNGNPSQQVGTTASPAVRGFLYVGGNFGASGSTAIHGVIYSPQGISGSSGGFTVFYDADVAKNILTQTSITRLSWEDSTRGWPSGL